MQRLTYKAEKATKEHIALVQCMRDHGHQVLQEATVTEHSHLPLIAFLATICCSECWVQKEKMFSHSPHLPVHMREKQALHWKERTGKKILTITRKGRVLCFQNPAATLWNEGNSFKPQYHLQIPSCTRTGFSWFFFLCLAILTI